MVDTEKDGVELKFLSNQVKLISKDNKLIAIKYEIMELGDKDESNKRKPVDTDIKKLRNIYYNSSIIYNSCGVYSITSCKNIIFISGA